MHRLSLLVVVATSFVILLSEGAIAETARWTSAIAKVEASAKEYQDYAVEAGGDSWAGTMYNGHQFDRHMCAILGRMLELIPLIKPLEEFEYPPIGPQTDPHDLLVFSISLNNWVSAARWALEANEAKRINTWNLDCVGQMGIPLSAMLESPQPQASFERDGTQLYVYGDIEFGFFDRFTKALDANPEITEIILGSAGGSVRDAILSGYEIRKRRLDTTIYGNCFSACPLVFIGGVHRVIWASPHRLGFHRIFIGNGAPVPLSDNAYKLILSYLNYMGVDALTVIRWMISAQPTEMFEPPPAELCPPNVATFVQRVCSNKGKF